MSNKSKMLSDEWGTPDSIFNLLPKGGYFDPCPHKHQAIEFVKQNGDVAIWRDGRGFNQFVDGLQVAWGSYNFVNPPFTDIENWVKKAYSEWDRFGNKTVFVLPNHTDRKWFRRSVQPRQFPVTWLGRIKFIPLTGQKVSQPQFGTGLLMIGYDQLSINRVIASVTPQAES